MTGCMLPALFASFHGAVVPPSLITPHGLSHPPPPSTEKTVLGERLTYWLDTDNFTIEWNDPHISTEKAEQTADALEEAWDRLVVDEVWGEPTSGVEHKIWVVLDESLAGTGVTTGYPTDDYPEGYPIIYLNSQHTDNVEFYASLCTHEFAHALQFRVRDWYAGGEREAWYWEASSEWMAEIARPELNAYAYSSTWYAAAPDLPYYSTFDYHQYGMFLVNAFLDEYRVDGSGIREIWLENTGDDWLSEIERVTGEPIEDTWAGFTGAYRAQAFTDSHLYVLPLDSTSPGEITSPFGSEYTPLGMVDGQIEIDGGIGAVVRDGTWMVFDDVVDIPEGDGPVHLVVTNPGEVPLRYTYSVVDGTDDEDDPEDTGEPMDSATPDEADLEPESPEAKGCACSSAADHGSWLWWVGLLGLVSGRRRPQQNGDGGNAV